ncbi:MAG: hypothetical protein Kow0096_18890 [Thiohalomonadaceae bacterium]
MSHKQVVAVLWVVLVLLTLGGSMLGETAEPGYALMLLITLTMAFKGRMVVDHFMELKNAHPLIRRLMQGYFYVLPLATLTTYLLSNAQL